MVQIYIKAQIQICRTGPHETYNKVDPSFYNLWSAFHCSKLLIFGATTHTVAEPQSNSCKLFNKPFLI
jgi:hypothetical protein